MSAAPSRVGLVAIGGAGWMGGANYVRNLACAIRAAAPDTVIEWICGEPLAADWAGGPGVSVVPAHHPAWARLLRRPPPLRRALDKARLDFLYPLTYDNEYNLGAPFPLAPHLGAQAWAGWVPDFQHRYLPELFSAAEIARRDRQIGLLVEEAPRVVLSSQSAAEDLRAFYPGAAGRAEVLTFATPPIGAEAPGDAPGPETPERFFLVCNQFWKHKNHLVIFDALRLLRDRQIFPRVLCTGQLDDYRDPAYAAEVRAAIDGPGLGSQVSLLGLIPRPRQVALLRRAIAVLQPSLFEGWSTLVEDARVLGRPCLLSDLAVHREQDPPGARFFPARSAEALAELMAEAWEHWPAGPNPAAEAAARETAGLRLAAVGRRFLEIAGLRQA